MKTRMRELAKPGIYGTVDNPIVVSERDLREIAETFVDVKRAPISLNGHWLDPSKPRLGNVVAVTFDESTKTLSGEIEEQDALADAVDQGFFPDCSIGSRRRASDGKMYLHHLAYLGEEPPAVKNLVADISRSLTEAENGEDRLAASDIGVCHMIPSPGAKRLNLSDAAATIPGPDAGASGVQKKPEEAPMKTLEEALAELKTAQDENAALKAQLADLAKKYPDAGIQLSDAADERVQALIKQVRDGKKAELLRAAALKVPKAKHDLVIALADSFHTGESIELSDGDKKVARSQFDVLSDLLASLPRAVEPGKIDLADSDSKEGPVDLSKIKGKY